MDGKSEVQQIKSDKLVETRACPIGDISLDDFPLPAIHTNPKTKVETIGFAFASQKSVMMHTIDEFVESYTEVLVFP